MFPTRSMLPRETQIPIERGRAAVRFGLYALVLCSPLPFGSVQPWAVMVLELWAACLGVGALWIIYRDPQSLSARARWLLVPAALLLLIGTLQLTPLTRGLVRIVASPTAQARADVADLLPETVSLLTPASLSPPDTVDGLLRLFAYILVGLAAAVAFQQYRHLRAAALVIVVSGVFQAVYGSAEYLSGHQHIFGYAKIHYLDSATGTFINRNHFAVYLAMTLPFALGAFLSKPGRLSGRHWRSRLLALFDPGTRFSMLVNAVPFLLVLGVFLSYSRGGLAAALVGSAVLFIAIRPGPRRFLVWALVFLVPAAFLSWQELRAPGGRFLSLPSDLSFESGRLAAWLTSLDVMRDYPVLGTGIGTFEEAFRTYWSQPTGMHYDHAHNDWLQAAVEGGAVLLIPLLGLLCLSLWPMRRSNGSPENWIVCRVGPAAAVVAVTLHSLMDFPVRIPAIAILLGFCVGMLASLPGHPTFTRKAELTACP